MKLTQKNFEEVVEYLKTKYYLIERDKPVLTQDVKELILGVAEFVSGKEGSYTVEETRTKSRDQNPGYVRNISIWIIKKIYNRRVSDDALGSFYNRDRATMIHSFKVVDTLIDVNAREGAKIKGYLKEYSDLQNNTTNLNINK